MLIQVLYFYAACWVSLLLQGDEAQKAQAVSVICAVLETLRIVAVALKPVVPRLSERMYLQLGFSAQQFQVRTGHAACVGTVRSCPS